MWACNCRGFLRLIEGNSLEALVIFKNTLPQLAEIFGGTRPHILTATSLHNLGVASYLSQGYLQSLRYFGRWKPHFGEGDTVLGDWHPELIPVCSEYANEYHTY